MPWFISFLKGSSSTTRFISFRNLFQKRLYNKWPVACSLPPMYKSTSFQYSIASLDANSLSFFASMYLYQYQLLPAQPGIVESSYSPSGCFQFSARPKGGSPDSV